MKALKMTLVAATAATGLLAGDARCAWNSESLQWAKNFNEEKVKFADADVITVWGGFKSGHVALYKTVNKNVFDLRLRSGQFQTGGVMSRYYAQKDRAGKVIPAPLVVYLPGIFDGFTNGAGTRAFYKYSMRGYHVLGVPNPWSVAYITGKPKDHPGNIAAEARTVLDLIQDFKNFLGAENITRIDIVGDSYGGLLSTATFSTDKHDPHPLIDGDVTVFSPPIDLIAASKALDTLLDKSAGIILGPCAIVRDGAKFIFDLYRRDTEAEMSVPTRTCARSLLAQSFREKLVNAAVAYENANDLKTIPSRLYRHLAFDNWQTHLRFSTFMDHYVGMNLDEENKMALLGYWIVNTPEAYKERFRIMTAHDDLLNLSENWAVIDAILPPNSVIVLPWGGHIGFEALPEFDNLLNASFGVLRSR